MSWSGMMAAAALSLDLSLFSISKYHLLDAIASSHISFSKSNILAANRLSIFASDDYTSVSDASTRDG